jgi:phosphohistidine phosphatase
MLIYLMQHGKSNPESEDPEEGLSLDGQVSIEESANALKTLGVKFDLIVMSPKKRSKMTAEIIAKTLQIPEEQCVETENIKSKSTAEETLTFLSRYAEKQKILIVGHLPSLIVIANRLLGDKINIAFSNGGCTCIEIKDLTSSEAILEWHLLPEQLRLIFLRNK